VKNSGDRGKRKDLDDDVDELFKLPLAEFTGARNALASRLKKSGRADDANLVKVLGKPSISAWTVNQLYWSHREAFERLLAAGQRFRKAQKSSVAGKLADMKGSLDARREALTQLSDLATTLLQDAGHNASQDTIRRITTTLEAISALDSLSHGPTPGQLSQDVDPPGFDSLASFVPGPAVVKKPEPPKVMPLREVREWEAKRQAKIAAAKDLRQADKKSLREAEERFKKATAELEKAKQEVEDAERNVEESLATHERR